MVWFGLVPLGKAQMLGTGSRATHVPELMHSLTTIITMALLTVNYA
jgi:hypothetical protein